MLFLTSNIFAIEGKIRVSIPSQEKIYTSQKITVSVELLSNAFSITNAKISFPASDKYIVQEPKSASYLGHEEMDDEDWQMVHYDYEVYTLKAGKVQIPSILVSFTASMGYGQPTKDFTIKSDALSFDVKALEGVREDQFVLVTDNFKLTSEIKPKNKQLIVGDTIELTVIQQADGVPDLLLTPIVYRSNEFLRVYEKEPLLESGLKGEYDVSRTDRFTFVASMEGNVTLSAQEILWYNSVSKEIIVEKIPAMEYEILPDPQLAIDAKKAQQKQVLFYVISIFVCILGFYMVFASKIRHYRQERKRTYEQSEAGKFDKLLKSINSDSVQYIYQDLYTWLELLDSKLARGGLRVLALIYPRLDDELKALEKALIKSDTPLDRQKLAHGLQEFRSNFLIKQNNLQYALNKALNP